MKSNHTPVALVTGAAERIGREIANTLHAQGYRIVIHYRHSENSAQSLAEDLNKKRKHSAATIQADFTVFSDIPALITQAYSTWQRLDALINNASAFFPNAVSDTSDEHWEQLINSNLKAPYFLSIHALNYLKKTQGSIINVTDIHGTTPLRDHPIYSISKAGINMLTKALAKELAPDIRVNAIAPGPTTCLAEGTVLSKQRQILVKKTMLQQLPLAHDIANGILFLLQQKRMTGQIITIDAGRSLRM